MGLPSAAFLPTALRSPFVACKTARHAQYLSGAKDTKRAKVRRLVRFTRRAKILTTCEIFYGVRNFMSCAKLYKACETLQGVRNILTMYKTLHGVRKFVRRAKYFDDVRNMRNVRNFVRRAKLYSPVMPNYQEHQRAKHANRAKHAKRHKGGFGVGTLIS